MIYKNSIFYNGRKSQYNNTWVNLLEYSNINFLLLQVWQKSEFNNYDCIQVTGIGSQKIKKWLGIILRNLTLYCKFKTIKKVRIPNVFGWEI